jgi:hypothetical protein
VPQGSWEGLASPAVRGEEDNTDLQSDGATGSGMAMRVRDDDGDTTVSIEAEGGVRDGVGTEPREVAAQRVGKLDSLTAQN